MSCTRYELRALAEAVETADIVELLSTSAVVESDKVLVRCAVILGKELTRAMMARDPKEKLSILEKTLKDTRALRSAASAIPDDNLTDFTWAAISCWWKGALKYGLGSIKNNGDITGTTRNATLGKFDVLIRFLKVEIAKTKLEMAKQRHQSIDN